MDPRRMYKYIAAMRIRSESVRGGAVPDDEVQADFIISTGDRDGHYSIMTPKTLENYTIDAQRGVPFMLGHGTDIDRQIGATIASSYDTAKQEVIATISMLRDAENTPDTLKNDEFIRRIERGMYNSVSVAFSNADEICNLCDKEIFDFYRDDPCPHIPGRTYDGQECTYRVDNANLRHVALVSEASNPNAKLLETREWPQELQDIKKDDVSNGGSENKEAKDVQDFRNNEIELALKQGVRAEDDFNPDEWREGLKKLGVDMIRKQAETWKQLGDLRWGPGGRKTGPQPKSSEYDHRPQIPTWIFD